MDPTQLQPIIDKLKQPGELTSEYKAFQSASFWAKVVMILSMLAFLGEVVAGCMGMDTKTAQYLTAGVGVCSQFLKILALAGYTRSRTEVKQAASEAIQAASAPKEG
jgi:hypothetical protein